MFRTDNFAQVATIPVGKLPHGVWPSGDGTRVYVGLENADALTAIDTADQHGDRDRSDRPGAPGDRLCPGCGSDGDGLRASAARRRRGGDPSRVRRGPAKQAVGKSADQRRPVRSRIDSGASGVRHRACSRSALCARAIGTANGEGKLEPCRLHDESRRFGDRERRRADPADCPAGQTPPVVTSSSFRVSDPMGQPVQIEAE